MNTAGALNGLLAERTDVILADLAGFLDDLEKQPTFDPSKIVLITSTESSVILPCCKQSLGYRNQQLPKLWAVAHWKTEGCRAYWKDVHVICVRKLRKNSAYAKDTEVEITLGDSHAWVTGRFLHNLKPVASPVVAKVVSLRQPFAARNPSAATPNGSAKTGTPRTATTSIVSPSGTMDKASPPNPNLRTALSKGRLSEPLLNTVNSTRSPIVTRRKSSVLKPESVDPKPVDRRTSVLRPVSAISPVSRVIQRKPSESSLASIRSGFVAARAVSAGSAIPTPTRRTSVNLLATVQSSSPGSPLDGARRTSLVKPIIAATRKISLDATKRLSQNHNVSPTTKTAGQLESSYAARLQELTSQIERLQRENGVTMAYGKDLEMENERLKKQKAVLVDETAKIKEDMLAAAEVQTDERKQLEEMVSQLVALQASVRNAEDQLLEAKSENEALQVQISNLSTIAADYTALEKIFEELSRATDKENMRNVEFEDKTTVLQNEKEKLQDDLTQSRAECHALIETLNQAEEKITILQAQMDDAEVASTGGKVKDEVELAEAKHETSAVDVSTLTPPSTPPATPLRIVAFAPAPTQSKMSTALARPAIAFLTPVRTPPTGSRKVRTPLSASVKRSNKKSMGIWKRLAKRRLFGL